MALNRVKISQAAEKLVRQGRFADAIREYQRLLDDSPHDVTTLNKVGDLFRRAGHEERAVGCYLRIADHYRGRGFAQKAIAMYKKVAKLDPGSAEVREQLATLYTDQGLVRDALENLREAARLRSDSGESERALELESRALELQPDDWNGLRLQAERLRDAGESERSVATFLRAAEGFSSRGALDEARDCCREAIRVAPLDPGPAAFLTRILVQAGRTDEAIQEIRELAAADPESAHLHALLGEALLGRGELDEAEKALTAAKGSAFAEGDVHYQTALLRLDLARGRLEHAEESLERVVGVLVEQGDCAAARALLRECLQVLPSSRRVLGHLADQCREADTRDPEVRRTLELLADRLPEEEMQPQLVEVLQALRQVDPDDRRVDERLQNLRVSPDGGESTGAAGETPPWTDDETFTLDGDDGSEVDRDFVSEHLTEADVFIKYGLLAKAAAHLTRIVERYPRTVVAHQRLVDVYQEVGDRDSANRHRVALAEAFRLQGTVDEGLRCLADAIAADPDNPALIAMRTALREGRPMPAYRPEGGDAPRGSTAPPPPVRPASRPAGATSPEVADEEEIVELSAEVAAGTEPPEPGEAPAGAPDSLSPPVPPAAGAPQMPPRGRVAERTEEPAPSAVPEPPPEPGPEAPPGIDTSAAGEAPAGAPDSLSPPVPPAAGAPQMPPRGRVAKRTEEPAPPAVPELPPEPGPEAPPRIDTSAAEEAPAGRAAPVDPGTGSGEEAAGGEFFDLAGAIEEELAREEAEERAIPVLDDREDQPDPATGIRQAIQDQVGAEDHQTHYQLGIAFKEMGMLDEAIGEFQQASRDRENFVSCCSMLGLCFREKGMPQIAEKWYSRGLQQVSSREPESEERLGLLYDLGELYLAQERLREARDCFLEVYASDANYRDVAARVRYLDGSPGPTQPPGASR
jgi:tetratricopeptide (TPR) repeat protein